MTRAVDIEEMRSANGGIEYNPPLCPNCHGGRLHPYSVEIRIDLLNGLLRGWVAICQGKSSAVPPVR